MGEKQLMLTLGLDQLLSVVVFLLLSLFGVFKHLVGKFDKRLAELEELVSHLDANSIRRPEFDQTIKIVRDEIQRGNSETHRRLDALLLKFVQEA